MNENKIYIISYYNLRQKLAGGLRANELFKYLKKNQLNVEIVSRKQSEGYETIVSDFRLPKQIRKIFHLIFPDSSITWVLMLYFFFKNKKNITLIVTSPPHGLIYLSFLLRKNKTIKIIHDFRDPFTLNAHPQKKIIVRNYLNKKIENFLTKNADYIVFNTLEHRKIYLKKYQNIFKNDVINNGYIYENFQKRKATKELVYFGGHYSGKVVDVLIKFMTNLNLKSNKNYVLDIYGEYHPAYLENNMLFNYHGSKNRSELTSLLLDYKIGIVCYTQFYEGRGIATKFYEILGLGITPYCINPSKDLINLMKDIELGEYCYEKEMDKIEVTFFDNFIPLKFSKITADKIKKYSRNNQNNKFLKIIDNL